MRNLRAAQVFTLIELLVVVAIISILASMLLPALMTARAKARAATCLSSIKGIYTAETMYFGDWDDAVPPVYSMDMTQNVPYGNRDTSNNGNWYTNSSGNKKSIIGMDLLVNQKYATVEMFICPDVNRVNPSGPGKVTDYCHYGQNVWVDSLANIWYGYVTFGAAPGKLTRAKRTDGVIFLAEQGIADMVCTYNNDGRVNDFGYNKGSVLFRHARSIAPVYSGAPVSPAGSTDPELLRYIAFYGSRGGANYVTLDGAGIYLDGNTQGLVGYAPNGNAGDPRRDSATALAKLWYPW